MHSSIVRRTALAALLLAACESSTGSEPMEGVYVAQSVNGRAVPAVLDSLAWSDGTTYTLHRLLGASVEFLDGENARYTFQERLVAYSGADSIAAADCRSVTLPYRREGGRVVLVVEPRIFGQDGRLRLDTLLVQNGQLVQNVRTAAGQSVPVTFAPAQQPEHC